MKTSLLALALSAGLVALPVAHAANNHDGFFVNGNVGQSSVDKGYYDDDDTAFGANLGYRWAVSPNVLIGIEGGYTHLGEVAPTSGSGTTTKAEVNGWTAGVNGHFNITDNWYVSARGGLFRAKVKGDYLDGGVPVYVNDHSNDWYAGAGFGYDFGSGFSVGLDYDVYRTEKAGLELDPRVISVSGEVRF
mgnify:CR=1 FL=1